MVYVQTQFDLDTIGYSATLPTYRTVLRREHRLGESEDEHLRRCRACAEPRPQIDWSVGHHGDRRAVVVNHDVVANLVGRPGASGMLVPMRFSKTAQGRATRCRACMTGTPSSWRSRTRGRRTTRAYSAMPTQAPDRASGPQTMARPTSAARSNRQSTGSTASSAPPTRWARGRWKNSDPVSAHSPGFPITSDVYPLEPGLMVLLPPIGPPVQPPVPKSTT